MFYEIYRHKHEGVAYKTRGFLVFYITPTVYTDRVIKVIQYRKVLYNFYYTLVTLTTGYKCHLQSLITSPSPQNEMCVAFGPGNDMFDSTRIIGEKQYNAGKVGIIYIVHFIQVSKQVVSHVLPSAYNFRAHYPFALLAS